MFRTEDSHLDNCPKRGEYEPALWEPRERSTTKPQTGEPGGEIKIKRQRFKTNPHPSNGKVSARSRNNGLPVCPETEYMSTRNVISRYSTVSFTLTILPHWEGCSLPGTSWQELPRPCLPSWLPPGPTWTQRPASSLKMQNLSLVQVTLEIEKRKRMHWNFALDSSSSKDLEFTEVFTQQHESDVELSGNYTPAPCSW